jgi:uncharacterized glyoxalase superfamily protein PhnB
MPPSAPAASDSLVPVLRYRDVAAAASWLTGAFGFESKTLIDAPDGGAIYAELVHGRGTIMLVPVGQSDLDAHMRQPDELGGIETQTCYVTVTDVSAHLERSIKGGAEIVLPLSGDQGGQRGYSCRDLEGHIWNFGTYSPVAGSTAAAVIEAAPDKPAPRRSRALPLLLTTGLVGLAAWSWTMPDNPLTKSARSVLEKTSSNAAAGSFGDSDAAARASADHLAERRQAQEAMLKLRQEAAEARTAAKAAQDAASAAAKDLAAEYSRRTSSEQGNGEAQARATKIEADLVASKAAQAALEAELLKERSARGQSVLAADAARAALEQETRKREHLEKLVEELDRKADDQLQAKSDTTTKPGVGDRVRTQSAAVSQAPRTAPTPSETGSVATPRVSRSTPERKPNRSVAPEKSKPVASKRSKPVTSSVSKSASAKKTEEKPWPYNAW